MHPMRFAALALLFSLSGGCSTTVPEKTAHEPLPRRTPIVFPSPSPTDEIVVPDVPKAKWQPIFFEGIDDVTAHVGLSKLRTTKLESDDIEVRVWGGFGLTTMTGFVLRRAGDSWSAWGVEWTDKQTGYQKRSLPEPASGWEPAWQSLRQHNILTLPDAVSINCESPVEDGYYYVVEVKKGPNYRTYEYGNPDEEKNCAESRDMLTIAKAINATFGLPF